MQPGRVLENLYVLVGPWLDVVPSYAFRYQLSDGVDGYWPATDWPERWGHHEPLERCDQDLARAHDVIPGTSIVLGDETI